MALDDRLSLRIDSDVKKTFIDKCEEHSVDPNNILREMVSAFNEDRMKISVPKNQPKQLELFQHVNRK